ncbi:hypothetical protein PBCVCviKI_260L [Paramecium bursaria Chlorella virus CviKI]|nr:hypothetical protein PBCVCviKI_260L [Paramecium bursaria Chlorella virus CviKI]
MTAIIARLYNGYLRFQDVEDDIEIIIPKSVRWADYCGMKLENIKIIPPKPDTRPVPVRHRTPVNYMKKDMVSRIIERYERALDRANKFIDKAGSEICSITTLMAVIGPEDQDYEVTKKMFENATIDYEIWTAKLKAVGAAINDFAYDT